VKRLLRQLGANLRQLAVRERRLERAATANQAARELDQRQRTRWAIRIFQVPLPDPSPVHAAVLDFCWRRPVLRNLLLGLFSTSAKLSYYLRLLAQLLAYPCGISMRHLRLLESQLQLLPKDAGGLDVAQGGNELAKGAEQVGHDANVVPLRRISDEVQP
jgi:hypothetical protein